MNPFFLLFSPFFLLVNTKLPVTFCHLLNLSALYKRLSLCVGVTCVCHPFHYLRPHRFVPVDTSDGTERGTSPTTVHVPRTLGEIPGWDPLTSGFVTKLQLRPTGRTWERTPPPGEARPVGSTPGTTWTPGTGHETRRVEETPLPPTQTHTGFKTDLPHRPFPTPRTVASTSTRSWTGTLRGCSWLTSPVDYTPFGPPADPVGRGTVTGTEGGSEP